MTVVIEGLWLVFASFLVIGCIVLSIYVIVDVLQSDVSVLGKLAYVVSFLVLPVVSVIVYTIVRTRDLRPYPGRRERPATAQRRSVGLTGS